MKTILLAPAYNEEGLIGEVVRRGKPFVNEVLVVDDASKDNTYKEAKEKGATVIRREKNGGAGSAIRDGIHYALKKKYDVIIVIAGDNQDSPEEIPRLLKKLDEGYDFVQGSRYLSGGKTVNIPLFRKITTSLHPIIIRFLLGRYDITESTSGFRAIRTTIFDDKRINIDQKWLNRYELEMYLFYRIYQLGHKAAEVPATKSWFPGKTYSKMVPILDWWRMLKPMFYLRLGFRK